MAFEPGPCPGCGGPGGGSGTDAESNLVCDTLADGSVVGSALAVYAYDANGNPTGPPTFVHPITGDPYVAQGTLQPCPGETGCLEPVQFCFTATTTGPVQHPGRLFDIDLPLNPGFALESIAIDAVTSPQNLVWDVNDATGQAFADELETRLSNLMPSAGSIVVTPPASGQNCGDAAEPFHVHIECLRLDQSPPDVIRLNYNAGQDLIQNPAYNETPAFDRQACPLGPLDVIQGYHLVKRQDNGGTISCTNTANRGWETNDQAGFGGTGTFEIWCPTAEAAEGVTATPRGTPTQEINSNGNTAEGGTTIWQTFQVTTPGLFKVRVVHGARDNGETHTIRLSTGDTNFSGIGDLINNVTQPAKVTTNGATPAAAWTTFSQDLNLPVGTYTLSIKSDNPTGNTLRGGLFTDARAYTDVPGQFVDSTRDDVTCTVETTETTSTTTCEWWSPMCESGDITAWKNAEDGQVLSNGSFWGQTPSPECCSSTASSGGSGTVSAGNLVHSYLICGVVGGVSQTLTRVVYTDQSGGVVASTIFGPDGGPVTPTSWSPGSCDVDRDIEIVELCDRQANGVLIPFLRRFVYDTSGAVVSTADTSGNGDPYFITGTVTTCSAAQQDLESTVLCDSTGTQFIRTVLYSANQGGLPLLALDYELDGTTAYVPVGTVGVCGNADRETACWTTTAGGGTVFHGSIRHDDNLPAPGWVLFDQNVTLVLPTEPGLTFVDCGEAVPATVAADHFDALPGTPWTPAAIPAGRRLTGLTYTVLAGTATVVDATGGTSVATIPAGYTGTWTTEDDRETLTPPASITAAAGSRVLVLMTTAL